MLTLRHPHLVPVYRCGDYTKGSFLSVLDCYLLMPWVVATMLAKIIVDLLNAMLLYVVDCC